MPLRQQWTWNNRQPLWELWFCFFLLQLCAIFLHISTGKCLSVMKWPFPCYFWCFLREFIHLQNISCCTDCAHACGCLCVSEHTHACAHMCVTASLLSSPSSEVLVPTSFPDCVTPLLLLGFLSCQFFAHLLAFYFTFDLIILEKLSWRLKSIISSHYIFPQ